MYFNQTSRVRILGFLAIFFVPAQASPITPRHKACNANTRLIYEFPQGTWIENMAVRASGELLVTLLNIPDLYLIDPFHPNPPVLVHTFPDVLSLSGIAEVTTDVFAVSSLNYSLSTGDIAPNSSIAWNVDLRDVSLTQSSNFTTLSPDPTISKIADLPSIIFPNGQCLLSSSDSTVLIGDIKTGVIYRLNTLTGDYSPVISDPSTAAVPQPIFVIAGVDGIHVLDGVLYLANAGSGIFAKMPINEDGTPAGNATVITEALEGDYFDDFVVRDDAAYLVTGSGNSIERVKVNGTGRQKIIAGSLNSTTLAEPTAVEFGRTEIDRDVLYVVTAGGLATPVEVGGKEVMVGGQVVAVDLSSCRW